jgi:release factor glutamine methyltransferase
MKAKAVPQPENSPAKTGGADQDPAAAPSLRALLLRMTGLFAAGGVDSPRLSAELLLAESLGLDRNDLLSRLIISPETPVPASSLAVCERLMLRRVKGEPVAYILGRKEFYGRNFLVSPAVLIPRPETELLADLALRFAGQKDAPHTGLFADFGTGSGCIAVTLALELPGWRGLALDRQPEALRLAARNANRLAARNLVFALADFTRPPAAEASLHLLLANPPYVSEEEYGSLTDEVRCFEPKSALVPSAFARSRLREGAGPATGLEDARSIIASAACLLRPGGLLLMEMGCAQARALLDEAGTRDWASLTVHQDLAGLDRVLAAQKKE